MLHFTFYTNNFIPTRFAATTYGFIVLVRPTYSNDAGLLAHELVHVGQFWKNPLFGLAYKFSATARLKYEAEAYREQLKYSPGKEELFATFLCTNYSLNITREEALAALGVK